MKRIEVTQSGKGMKKELNLLGERDKLCDVLRCEKNIICIYKGTPGEWHDGNDKALSQGRIWYAGPASCHTLKPS